jgi:hypothetical protein
MLETVTSSCMPGCAKAGRFVVTNTEATFFTLTCVAEICIPIFCNALASICVVKMVCWRSPVPFSPTTRPYPTRRFSRTPSTVASSRTRAVRTWLALNRPGASSSAVIAASVNHRTSLMKPCFIEPSKIQ